MSIRKLTCINCPLGCLLEVTLEEGRVTGVEGNTCPRGKRYAEDEVTCPKRVVTSTLPAGSARVSVKTVPAIPKERIFDVMYVIHGASVTPPVRIGDVIIKNIAGTGSDLVATSEAE